MEIRKLFWNTRNSIRAN